MIKHMMIQQQEIRRAMQTAAIHRGRRPISVSMRMFQVEGEVYRD
jgi:hypothetical protein